MLYLCFFLGFLFGQVCDLVNSNEKVKLPQVNLGVAKRLVKPAKLENGTWLVSEISLEMLSEPKAIALHIITVNQPQGVALCRGLVRQVALCDRNQFLCRLCFGVVQLLSWWSLMLHLISVLKAEEVADGLL